MKPAKGVVMEKFAQDIMSTHLITIRMDDSVQNAYGKMSKNRIRHLPVVDETGFIIGILSDRDVQRCVRFDRKASLTNTLDLELNLDPKIRVADAMSWPAHKVDGETPVRDIAIRMLNEKLSSMVVECKRSGRSGIVTTDDLLRLLISLLDKDPGNLRLVISSMLDGTYSVAR